jgi:hypothetical protein
MGGLTGAFVAEMNQTTQLAHRRKRPAGDFTPDGIERTEPRPASNVFCRAAEGQNQWPVSQDSCRSDKLIDTPKAPGNRQTIGDDKRRVLIMFKGVEQPGIRTVIC